MQEKTNFFNKRQIFGIFFAICINVYLIYFHKIFSIVPLWIYILSFSCIVYLWRLVRKKQEETSGNFFHSFVKIITTVYYRVAIAFLVVFTIVGGFSYYFNEISPASIQKHVLTNGEKTLVFQGMSHIAFPHFYESIQKDLENKRKDGFVYYWEGVKPGKKESHDELNNALGFEMSPTLYETISKLMGVTHQKHDDFLSVTLGRNYNIDISADEIAQLLKEKNNNKENSETEQKGSQNIELFIERELAKVTEYEKMAIGYYYRAIFNAVISGDNHKRIMKNNEKKDIFEIILDKRNEHLAQEIINSEHKKIFTTYGALHFDGVYEILKKNDPNWKIIESQDFYPLKK